MQKNNQLKQDKSVDVEIERLYRIAAENGHYKANINLQHGAMRVYFQLRGDEHLRLSQRLIDEGVATGYSSSESSCKQGSAGLKQDPEMALRYYRKAADSGNAQAQTYVARNWHRAIWPRTSPGKCARVLLNKAMERLLVH